MDTGRWRRIGEIFEQVAGLEGEARERALAEHCGDDEALRREVVSLLEADRGAEAWLAGLTARAGIPAPEAEAALNAPGRTIGAWRLVRRIGRGGMGVVYLAERADGQFPMQAALKALPVGLITREAVERFRREREILAGLDHPHIARLLDGGVTPEGTPFYVMEYVAGLPLNRYCAEYDPSLEARRRLFERIASAVAYAHRHLVIHRDIKPANVLVTDEGEPKLLDFGVAKLMDVEAEATATATQLAQRRVTPAYTAPELLQGQPVTTACDVYSLGVVLYELLAGAPPFEPGFFEAPGWTDRLAEYRPPPPSRASGDERLRGDLDTIAAMAMHPDPARRYPTVNALLADLERHDKRLPVAARPDTLGYRMNRFIRRHAVGTALTGLALLALVTGTAVSLWQAERAQRQSERALTAQRQAEREQARAVATRDFLVDLFHATVPDLPPDEMPDTESLLSAGTERVLNAEGLNPVLRADMLTAMSEIYMLRGRHDEARPLVEKARELAAASRDEAPEVYTRAIITWSKLRAKNEGPGKAVAILEELVGFLKKQAPDSAFLLEARFELAGNHLDMRNMDEGIAMMRAVNQETQGRDDVTDRFRRRLKTRLAHMLFYDGQYDAAAPLYEEAIEIGEKLRDPNHRAMAVKLVNAASNDLMLGRFDKANERYERAMRIHHAIGDAPSETHAAAHVNYGSALAWQGRVEEANRQYRKAIEIEAEFRGLDSPDEFPLKEYRVAYILMEVGNREAAGPYLEKALKRLDGNDAFPHARLMTLHGLAQQRCSAGDAAGGREYLARFRRASGDRKFAPWVEAEILEAEARCHRASGDLESALAALDEVRTLNPAPPPGAAGGRARRALLRARLHEELGNRQSAESELNRARQALENAGLESHPLMSRIREFREQALSGRPRAPTG